MLGFPHYVWTTKECEAIEGWVIHAQRKREHLKEREKPPFSKLSPTTLEGGPWISLF